jgi:mono/diheme cytochrome c family protein
MFRKSLIGASFCAGLLAVAGSSFGQSDAASSPPSSPSSNLYTVQEGYKVDPETMKGFRAWRQAACDRCHGANQEGLVGPSLVNSLKTLSKEDFIKTVRDGRLEKGMQSFGNSPAVMDNINQLYAYLKGRSDGAITRAKVEPIQQ